MAYIGNGSDTITRQEYNFVATEGQTTFVADYTVGYVDVFWNGFKIDSSEYVANNGTNIIVNNALKAGDKFSVIAYNAFNIANTYSKTETETYVTNYVNDNKGISLATANSYDLGVGQTWQDVTASRSAGTTYTNSTGKAIAVNVGGAFGSAVIENLQLTVNGIVISRNAIQSNTTRRDVSGIVPNGATYSVTIESSRTINAWLELR